MSIRTVSHRCFSILAVLLVSGAICPAAAPMNETPPQTMTVSYFPLEAVRLLDSPFAVAQQRNLEYVLALEVDRLTAPFRREAGLEPKASSYPNWESSGLDGHTAGHYLTALAQLWAATGNEETRQRLAYMVEELAACQDAYGDGYVGGVPGSRQLWEDIAAGRIQADNFGLNRKWVPWYNLHKTFAGLRDAWLIGGNAQAREVLIGLSDWCDSLVAGLSDAQLQDMLRSEHGGMNEVLADVYAITGDEKYLALAERFSHRVVLNPLLLHQDRLTGLHANTQIPKVIGFARIGELANRPSWSNAARYFWETVSRHRSVAIGGNSVREHFNPRDDFSALIESREGPETCNTYNMLRLSEQLFRTEPAADYADYYERALYNHILSTVHPDHGGFVYFTPMRPRHYRVYSQPDQCFWCCVGSGIENHGKYGRFIYAHAEDTLFVNLFIPSTLSWPEQGLTLRQETRFPDEPATTLTVELDSPKRFAIRLRHPGWMRPGDLQILVNGQPWEVSSSPASYEVLEREWQPMDVIEVRMPMSTRAEPLPDQSGYVALMHGPIALAAVTGTDQVTGLIADDARFAHIAPGPYQPLDQAPMLVGDPAAAADHVLPVPNKPMTFHAPDIIRPERFQTLELIPFFRVHDSRYMLYWRTVRDDEYPAVAAALKAEEDARSALDARTLDRVIPGEQQPEVEHNFQGEDTNNGAHMGRTWRDAGGWFSYDLQGAKGQPAELQVTYSAGERRRSFQILVNEQPITTVRLNGNDPDSFVSETYPIPEDITDSANNGVLTVKFAATPRSRAGAIYDVRLLRKP